MPEIIWITLFAGAGLTVCFALFFGSPNGLAHLAMTAVLSIVLAAGLVVIIALTTRSVVQCTFRRNPSNTCSPLRNTDSAKCEFEGAIARKRSRPDGKRLEIQMN